MATVFFFSYKFDFEFYNIQVNQKTSFSCILSRKPLFKIIIRWQHYFIYITGKKLKYKYTDIFHFFYVK